MSKLWLNIFFSFNVHLPDDYECEIFISCTFCPSVIFEKMSIQIIFPFMNRVRFFMNRVRFFFAGLYHCLLYLRY